MHCAARSGMWVLLGSSAHDRITLLASERSLQTSKSHSDGLVPSPQELASKQKQQPTDPSPSAGLIPASIAPEPAATAAATAPMQLPGATASVAPEAALKRDFSDLKDLAATPRLERSQAEAAGHHHQHQHQQHVDSDTGLAGGHNSSSSNAAAAEACDASTAGVSSSHCQGGSEAPVGTQQQLQQGQHGQQQQQQQEGALTEHGRRTSRSLGNRVQPIDPANAA